MNYAYVKSVLYKLSCSKKLARDKKTWQDRKSITNLGS